MRIAAPAEWYPALTVMTTLERLKKNDEVIFMIRPNPLKAHKVSVVLSVLLLIPVLLPSDICAQMARTRRDIVKGPEASLVQEVTLRPVQVSDRVWALFGRGGNIGVVITDGGVVVIDTQYESVAPAIVEQIRALTDQPIRYIVNTHLHGDHVGGNAVLQRYGVVVAHKNTYDRMLAGWEGTGMPGREDGLPQLTFQDELRLYLGGVEIQLFHLGRGHTDTDVVVWIPSENVVHVGDLFFNKMAPYVDMPNGAHTGLWISFIDGVIQRINPDTRVIPGHGELSDVDGLRGMGRFLQAVRSAVQKAHAEGKSREEILSLTLSDLGEEFADWNGRRLSMALSAAYAEIVGSGPIPPE